MAAEWEDTTAVFTVLDPRGLSEEIVGEQNEISESQKSNDDVILIGESKNPMGKGTVNEDTVDARKEGHLFSKWEIFENDEEQLCEYIEISSDKKKNQQHFTKSIIFSRNFEFKNGVFAFPITV